LVKRCMRVCFWIGKGEEPELPPADEVVVNLSTRVGELGGW